MKTKQMLFALFSGLFVFSAGCTPSVQNLSSDPKLDQTKLATIRIVSTNESGRISTSATIEKIDDKTVDLSFSYAAIDPGEHSFAISFTKVIKPEGLNLRVTMNLLGRETTLREPEPSEVFSSTAPRIIFVNVSAGKRYKVFSSDNLQSVSAGSVGGVDLGQRIVGFWTPRIVEE